MAHRPKGAIATRVAVGLASLAFPLAAAGAAQAAIAGAQPASMSNHPVLRSATIDASNPYEVHVCFDKAVLLNGGTSYFAIGGYSAYSLNTYEYEPSQVTADSANANCINAFYNNLQNGGTQGLTQFTVFQADGSAVTAQNGGGQNYTDTVGVTGSTSHAGTRGNSSPPDLAGIIAPTSASPNTYTFVFNKAVAYTSNTGYDLILADGTEVPSSAASVVPTNPTYVEVTFPATYGGENVNANATQGFVGYETVWADYDYNDYGNLAESAPLASATATLAAPHVVSAVLNSDNDSITYTFNETVNTSGVTAGDFFAELANGSRVAATGVVPNSSTTGTTTVTATFSKELANQAEFAVVAYAAQGAVTSFTPTGVGGTSSVDSSAPIGGNPGAFARAFTTAPDVFGVTINKSVGSGSNQAATITVSLDDRTRAITARDITLYDKTGQVVSTGGACTVPNGTTTDSGSDASAFANGPGPETVTCSYPLGTLDTVTSVGFGYDTFQGTIGTYSAQTTTPAETSGDQDSYSVAQIDAPVPTAAIVRAYKVNLAHIRAHKAHKAHKAHRTHKKH